MTLPKITPQVGNNDNDADDDDDNDNDNDNDNTDIHIKKLIIMIFKELNQVGIIVTIFFSLGYFQFLPYP